MPEPSASEILGMRVDPEQGGEVPVPLLKEGSAIAQLNQNARYSAENKWRRYHDFLDNLKDAYKGLDDISGMEVYTPDREYLQNETKKIYSELGSNPRNIYNPEIMGRIAKLKSEATESKLNRVYDFAHREFLARNPELDTDENKKRFEEFYGGKLGQRKPFALDVPVMFDPTALRTEIFQSPDVKRAVAESGLTKDGQLINETTGLQFVRKNFLDKWDNALSYEHDKYGRPIKVWAEEQFNKLSPQQQQSFGGTVEKFWSKLGEDAFGDPQDFYHKTKDDLQVNTNYLKKENLALDKQKLGLDWAKFDYAKDEDKYAASAVLNEARDIISKGGATQLTSPGGGKETVLRIGEPELLKTFGSIDKDGRVTNVPDAVYYDKDKDQVRLIYYQKTPVTRKKDITNPNEDVYTSTGGEIKKSETGDNLVERQVTMDQRTWLKEITKRSFPNKDIGTINHLVDDALTQGGNSLFKIVQGKQAEEQEANYINNQSNVQSIEGDKVTYKDGRVYQIVGNKMKRIN